MHLSRRSLLIGSALVLAACGGEPSTPSTDAAATTPAEQPPSLQTEIALIALYAAVRRTYPGLDAPLADLEGQHVEHLRALGGTPQEVDPPPVASTQASAIEQCMVAETQAANAHQGACIGADPAQARLLTLLAASEASHVPALRALR